MPNQVPFQSVSDEAPSGAPGGNYQQASASPDAFGAGLGRSLSEFGKTAYDQVQAKEQISNELYANDASVPGMQEYTKLWEGFGNLKGSAAQAAVPKFNEDIENVYRQAVENAPNDQAKLLLARPMRQMANYYLRAGQGHASTQMRTWQETSANARADELGNQAALIASSEKPDWTTFDQVMNGAVDEKRKLFEAQGYGLQEQDGLVRKFRGKFLSSIIQEKADNDPEGAVALMGRYADQMDAESRVTAQNKLRPQITKRAAEESGDEILGRRMPAGELPQTEIAGVAPGFLNFVKRIEGFAPQAKWDYKQFSNGYGTKAEYDGEVIDKKTAETRFNAKINEAAKEVDAVNPNLDPGTRAALISLTYNAGSGWANAGLGAAVRTGDLQKARELFLQYNKAGGETNRGLTERRYKEASWFGRSAPPETTALPDKDVAIGEAMTRFADRPALQAATISYLEKQYALNNLMTARAKEVFKERVKDSSAEALARGNVEAPITEDEFIEQYGVEDGLKGYADYANNLQLGADMAGVSTMSPAEQAELRGQYAPQPGEGFVAQQERLDTLEKAIKASNDERDRDPGLFAMNRLPTVRAAYDEFSAAAANQDLGQAGQRAAAARFAQATMDEQARIGVPLDKIQVLPKQYAENLKAQLNNLTLAGGGEKLAAAVQAQADLWGQYWPQVYKSIAKDAGSFLRVVGAGVQPDAARDLADVANMTAQQILKDDDTKIGALKTAVNAEFAQFSHTTTGQYGTVGLFNDVVEQGTKLAALYVMRGESSDKAAEMAYQKTVGFKYDFADSWRLPKNQGYSLDEISRGQEATVGKLNEFDIQPFTSSDGALDEPFRREETLNALRRDGVWVTSPNEDGLALLYNGEAVKLRDGKNLIVPWGDLALRAQFSDAPLNMGARLPEGFRQ